MTRIRRASRARTVVQSVRRASVLGAAALVALTTCAALHAQQNALELNRRVAGELAQFADRDWNVRARAFYSLLSLSLPDGFNGRTWLMRSRIVD